MTDTPPCQLLDWDSRFFGFRIARVLGERLTLEQRARIFDWCHTEQVRCLYFLAVPDDDQTVRLAEAAGFHLVDVRMELAWRATDELHPATSSAAVRPFRADDLDELGRMVTDAYSASRFAVDPHFGAVRATKLFQEWIERSCRGWADAVLVAPHGGRAGGFVTCHLDAATEGRIGLLGVSEEARGAGLGGALVGAAQDFFRARGVGQVSVVTQARNVAAQRLYQTCGFRTRAVGLWFHRWFEGTERE